MQVDDREPLNEAGYWIFEMARNQTSPKMTPIMLNYRHNMLWFMSANKTDLGGLGFDIAKQVCDHSSNGCTKIAYSLTVPGLVVLHAPRGYLTYLKRYYGNHLRLATATQESLLSEIKNNAKTFEITVDANDVDRDIENLLAPSARSGSFAVSCAPELYNDVNIQLNELRDKAA